MNDQGLKDGIFAWIQNTLKKALEAEPQNEQVREIAKTFSTETARRFAALMEMQGVQVSRDQDLQAMTADIDKLLKIASDQGIKFNLDAVTASLSNLWQSIEHAGSAPLISSMQGISKFLNDLSYLMEHSNPFTKEFWLGKDFDKGDVHPQSYAPSGGGRGAVQLRGDVNIDGRRIGNIVAASLADGMNRPNRGSALPDLRASPYGATSGLVAT